MNITAIAQKGDRIAPEFEEAEGFSLVSGSGEELSVKEITVDWAQGSDGIAKILMDQGVTRVLAAGIGEGSLQSLEKASVQVFYGATGSLSDGLNIIRLGILDSMSGGCGGGCGSGGCGGCGSQDSGASTCGSSGCGSSGCGCN